MKKVSTYVQKKMTYTIELPTGEQVTIGPGISNVETPQDSLKETDMKRMKIAAKAAAKIGVFDKEDDYGRYIPISSR